MEWVRCGFVHTRHLVAAVVGAISDQGARGGNKRVVGTSEISQNHVNRQGHI